MTDPQPSPIDKDRRESPGRRASDKETVEDLQALRNQLQLARENLEKMERLRPLAVVASSVVHDIRNSLGVISSTSQFVLTRLNPSEKEREAWMLVERNVDNIKGILKGYLGLARSAEVAKQPTSLNDLVQRVVRFVDSQSRKLNIKIEKDLDASAPLLPMDATGIEAAVLNLAINALEAMGSGGTLTFRTKVRTEKKKLYLEVQDDGPGMDADLKAKIFAPFFTTKKTGTGIGLYSSKASVELNGGDLFCESEPGKGTKMVMAFPLDLGREVQLPSGFLTS